MARQDRFPDPEAEARQERHECRDGWQEALRRAGLDSLAGVFRFSRDGAMRDVPERLTVRLKLQTGEGAPLTAYLKRHWHPRRFSFLSQKAHGEARREWDNTRELAATGLGVPQALGCGWGRLGPDAAGWYLCAAVPGEPADDFLKREFPLPQRREGRYLAFLQALAAQARKFHRGGYSHQDFYLCHHFVAETAPGRFQFSLIDLQRVHRWPSWLQHRWIVKDLAQLAYSCPPGVSRSDMMAFFLQWKGASTLEAGDRRLLRGIIRKVAILRRREAEGKVR
ncbi:MAG: hypothetical protein RL095_2735 [Verrucomicrobiota bacterium]|jgi:hypothetical protein